MEFLRDLVVTIETDSNKKSTRSVLGWESDESVSEFIERVSETIRIDTGAEYE